MTLGELKPDWPISELKQLDGGGLPMGLLPAPPTTLTLRAQALEVLPPGQDRGSRANAFSSTFKHKGRARGRQVGGREEVWSLLRVICLWYQAMRAAGWLTGMVTGCWKGTVALKSS